MSYKVILPTFEGPFDLLVYLIENARMSIYDIQVSEITSQYLAYMEVMKEQNITLATEFMVLAAELIEIKSKMMLPRPRPEGEITAEPDPRLELAERLRAYKECKQQSEILQKREEQMAGIFEKPQEDISEYTDHPDEYLSLGLEEFGRAFRAFLERKQRIEEVRRHYTMVERERETMGRRMVYIRDRFIRMEKEGVRKTSFRELVPKKDRYDVVISFVSLLQMMSDKYLDATQKKIYGDITVTRGERSFEKGEED